MGSSKRVLETEDAHIEMKRIVSVFCYEIDLITKILKSIVHGCGGKKKDLCFYAFLDNILHQPLITASVNKISLFILFPGGIVSKVVGFIDDHKIKVAPVDGFQVNVTGISFVPA